MHQKYIVLISNNENKNVLVITNVKQSVQMGFKVQPKTG